MKRFARLVTRSLFVGATLVGFTACDDDGEAKPTDTAADTSPDTASDTVETPDVTEDTAPDAVPDVAEDTTPTDTAPDTAADTDTPETVAPGCEPTEPLCTDEQIATLQLSDEASGGAITEEGTEPGVFITHIDATAGGFNGTLGYTYARFTDAGLEAVELSDEDAFESTDWDIAARRFVLRLNSGVAGPSCVLGGRTAPSTTFDTLGEVPDNIVMRAEQYFTADGCEYVPDTSGIGSPQTVLSSFWSYSGCVAMTDYVYVIQLANGRHVKLQVLSYYSPQVQETCDKTDAAPTPNGSGNIRIKWAYLD